jgi:hypothetical protein
MFGAIGYQSQLANLPDIERGGLLRWYDASRYITSTTWGDITNNQNATVNGGTIFNNFPYYVNFAGTNQFAGSPASSTLSLSSMTISAWIQMKSGASTQFCWVSQRSATNTSGTRYSLHINAGGNVLGIYNGAAFNTVSTTIDSDIWYFITAVLTTTNCTYYKDTTALTAIGIGLTTGAGDEPFGIATPNYGLTDFSSEFLIGQVGDVFVYNGNLTAEQITRNYNATKSKYHG